MLTRFAIRNKATGEWWSPRPANGRRKWAKHVNDADLWKRRGDVSLAMHYIPEVKEYMKKNSMRHLSQWRVEQPAFPVEVVTFNVLLIDANKGFIG